jgi:hypothetical protein
MEAVSVGMEPRYGAETAAPVGRLGLGGPVGRQGKQSLKCRDGE